MPNVLVERYVEQARPRGARVLTALIAALAAARRTREEREAAQAELRERILRAVERDPGVSPSRLVAELGVGWSSFYLQLKRLVAQGTVRRTYHGRNAFLYPAGMVGDPALSVQRSVLLGGRARLVAAEIERRPGHSVASLAQALGISPRVIYHHVRRLTEARLVESSVARGYRDLRATDRLRTLLPQDAERP